MDNVNMDRGKSDKGEEMSEWQEYKLGQLIERGSANLQIGPFGTMLNSSEYTTTGVPDGEAKKLGVTEFEYAFYTAVANNNSAKELMQQDKLCELVVILTQLVRENASIDWTIKESVEAKLKVIVKRTLRQFGYPPDMQLLATETVLKQAEMIANELAGK
jgi:hypothetical protein